MASAMRKLPQNVSPSEGGVHSKFEKAAIPRGREAVMQAILDATEMLLTERSPSRITVREIAATANIKHPLIHRHFKTKDEVILAVHARSIQKIHVDLGKLSSAEGSVESFFKAVLDNKFRQITLAKAMIDGVDPNLLQHQFPTMEHALALIKKRNETTNQILEFEPEIFTAALGGMLLGWVLFEPFLRAATNLEDRDDKEIQGKIVEIIESILRKVH
jgi:TetR/AcrR family transcriptional regulator, repressor for neighboring sulfatase